MDLHCTKTKDDSLFDSDITCIAINALSALIKWLSEYVESGNLDELKKFKDHIPCNVFLKIINPLEVSVNLLTYAGSCSQVEIIKWLIECGAAISQKNHNQRDVAYYLHESIDKLTLNKEYKKILSVLDYLGPKLNLKHKIAKGDLFYCMDECIKSQNYVDLAQFKYHLPPNILAEYLNRTNRRSGVKDIDMMQTQSYFTEKTKEILNLSIPTSSLSCVTVKGTLFHLEEHEHKENHPLKKASKLTQEKQILEKTVAQTQSFAH